MITVTAEGVGEVVAHLDGLTARMTEELRASIARLSIRLQTKVKQDMLSGQVLGVRTGRGKRSIHQDVQVDGARVSGVVSTNLFYMVGWETGWQGAGEAGLKSTKSKFSLSGSGDTFKNGSAKKRSFLVPSLMEMEQSGEIKAGIEAGVGKALL